MVSFYLFCHVKHFPFSVINEEDKQIEKKRWFKVLAMYCLQVENMSIYIHAHSMLLYAKKKGCFFSGKQSYKLQGLTTGGLL